MVRQFVLHSPLDGGLVVGPLAGQRKHLPRVGVRPHPSQDHLSEPPASRENLHSSSSALWPRKIRKRKTYIATTGTAVRVLNRDRSHASSKVRLLSEVAAAQSDYDAWQRPQTTSSLPVDLPLIETALGLSATDLHDLSAQRHSQKLGRARASLLEKMKHRGDNDGSPTSYHPDCPPVHIPSPEPSLPDDEQMQVDGWPTGGAFSRVVGVAGLAAKAAPIGSLPAPQDKTVSWGPGESRAREPAVADPAGPLATRTPTPPSSTGQHSKALKPNGRVQRLNKRIRAMRRNTHKNLQREASSLTQNEDRADSGSECSGKESEKEDEEEEKEAIDMPLNARSRFEACARLSKVYHMPLSKIRAAMIEFSAMDNDGNGFLTIDEFKAGIRQRSELPGGQEFPEHLLEMQWSRIGKTANRDEASVGVSFADYLAWIRKTAFTEQLLVTGEQEKWIRQLARDCGMALPDVEKLKKMFDLYDADGSGCIDKEEFKTVVCTMMNVKDPRDISKFMLDRYWREVDTDGSGEVEFEEFLKWYIKTF